MDVTESDAMPTFPWSEGGSPKGPQESQYLDLDSNRASTEIVLLDPAS
jgi:hypothetical protein